MPERSPRAIARIASALVVVLAVAAPADGAVAQALAPPDPIVRIAAPRVVVGPRVTVVATARPAARIHSIQIRIGGRVVARALGARTRVRLSARRLATGSRRVVVVVRTLEGRRVVRARTLSRPQAGPRRAPRSTPPPAPLNEAPPAAPDPLGELPGEPDLPFAFLSPLPGATSWIGDFETGNFSQWTNKGGGQGTQRVADDRIRLVSNPVAQGHTAVRIEVRRGDRWRGSPGNRAELVKWTGEREGDEGWYQWSTMFAPDFPHESTQWQIWTQWHTEKAGTQPMLKFWASDDTIGMSTTGATPNGRPTTTIDHWTAPIDRGRWHTIRLHVRWSTTLQNGFVELWHDGVRVVAPSPAATLVPGGSPNYLKQGLYRSGSISPTAVLYHDAMSMAVVRKS
jgi:hypothetical protein